MMSNKKALILSIFVMIFIITSACGPSTSQQLSQVSKESTQTSVPPAPSTEKASQPNQENQISAPTEIQPTSIPTQVPPTAVPTEAAKDLSLLDERGFVQDGISVFAVFMVENPNQSLAIENSEYQLAVYDESGSILKAESGYISLVLPGEKLAVGSNVFLEEGQKAAKIDIQTRSGNPEPIDVTSSPFTMEQEKFIPDNYFPKITGVMKNGLSRDVTNLRVTAVAYDDAGVIVGGGYTYVDFVPGSGQSGIEVGVKVKAKPSTVKLFPALSGLSIFDETTNGPELKLVAQGYSVKDRSLGIAFLAKNSDQKMAIEGSQYQAAVYDSDGNVIDSESGYISFVFPGQQVAEFVDALLPEGKKVDKVVIQVKTGDPVAVEQTESPFTTENIQYLPDTISQKVTGIIKNTDNRLASNLETVVVAYDENDAIIGGGFTYVNFVPANGYAPVQMSVNITGKPVKIEMYPLMSSLSDLKVVEEEPIKLITQGQALNSSHLSIGFIVENTDSSMAYSGVEYQAAAYDETGNVLGVDSGYLSYIFPSSQMADSSSLYLPDGKQPAKVEIQIHSGEGKVPPIEASPFTTEGVKFIAGSYSNKATGIIKNSSDKEYKNIEAIAIAYDESGEIIGSGFAYVDFVPANGQAAVEVSIEVKGNPAKIDIFPTFSSLSDIGG